MCPPAFPRKSTTSASRRDSDATDAKFRVAETFHVGEVKVPDRAGAERVDAIGAVANHVPVPRVELAVHRANANGNLLGAGGGGAVGDGMSRDLRARLLRARLLRARLLRAVLHAHGAHAIGERVRRALLGPIPRTSFSDARE